MKTPTITVYSKATGQPVIINPDDFDKSLYSESEPKPEITRHVLSKSEPVIPEQEKIAEPETDRNSKTRNTGRKKTAGEDSLLE